MSSILFPSVIVIVSKRNSGKSYFVERFIIDHLSSFDEIWIMSSTVRMTKDYSAIKRILKGKTIKGYCGPFDMALTQALIARQEKNKSKRVLLLLDDVVNVLTHKDVTWLDGFVTMSRHINMSLIMSLQRANVTYSPTIRQNTDYLLVSKINKRMVKYVSETTVTIDEDTLGLIIAALPDYAFLLYDNMHNNAPLRVVKYVS